MSANLAGRNIDPKVVEVDEALGRGKPLERAHGHRWNHSRSEWTPPPRAATIDARDERPRGTPVGDWNQAATGHGEW